MRLQVKLVHFLLRILCSYYGKDKLKKNLLAKNTHVKQTIGVSIPSVQMADLRKEDQDPTKFTNVPVCSDLGNVPVCSDVNEDHFLTSEVKVDCLNDVCEVNDRFIALVSHDTLPLSRDTNNNSINGSVGNTELTFLVDTGANVTAIKVDVWRQIPPPTKHPTSQTTISHIKSISGELIPVLGQVEVPSHIHSRNHTFCSILNHNVVSPFLIWLNFLTRLLLFYWHFFTPHPVLVFIAASRLGNTERPISMLCLIPSVAIH